MQIAIERAYSFARLITAGFGGFHASSRAIAGRHLLLVALAANAHADDGKTCDQGNQAACNRLLASPDATPQQRGLAHYNLGTMYAAKREDDQAIAEFSEAIKVIPNLAQPFSHHG